MFKNILIYLLINEIIAMYRISSIIINSNSQTKLGSTNNFIIKKGCHEISVPNNYKKVVLNLDSKFINMLLITDKKIEKCNESKYLNKCCSSNSTFCIENSNPTKNEFHLNYCIEKTYLYACILSREDITTRILQDGVDSNKTQDNSENSTEVANITIDKNSTTSNTTSESIKNKTDEFKEYSEGSVSLQIEVNKDEGCYSTEYIAETECSSLGLNNCKDSVRCLSKCSYVECRKEQKNSDSNVFSMCLPAVLTDNEILNRCKNHIEFSEPTKNPQVYRANCQKGIEENNPVQKETSHSLFKFILILFGVVLLATFIASVYYRFKISIDGVAPFEAPSFVPNFVFPRQTPYY